MFTIEDYDRSLALSEFDHHNNNYGPLILQSDGSWLHADGEYFWYNESGQVHREDGPAIIEKYDCGLPVYDIYCWYLNDIDFSFGDFLDETPASDEVKMMLKLKYG